MKNFIRQFALAVLIAAGFVSTHAAASELSDAFASVSYSNGVDGFNTEVRTGMSFGSGAIRFGVRAQYLPKNTVTFTPPSIAVSCNGISWHFGGFSFVNGDEIIQAIEAALPAAAMYVLGIVVSGLCEQCWTGLQHVFDAVNKVTNALRNSCALGAALAESSGLASAARSVREDLCTLGKAAVGSSTDQMASSSSCKQAEVTNTYFKDVLDSITGSSSGAPDDVDAANATLEEQCPLIGNTTWCVLNQLGIITTRPQCKEESGSKTCSYEDNKNTVWGELFQSMIGATYSADSTLAGNAPSATVKELIEYLMCGTYAVKAQPPSTSASSDPVESTVANHCWNAFHPSEPSSSSFSAGPRNYPKILACTSGAAAPTNIESDTCAPVAEVTLDVWLARPDVQQVVGKGFLFHVATLLHSVVQKMKSGSPISDDEKKFIQAAPFPLYRLLNLASLFPAVELDLVDTNSVLIAYMMSHEMINQQLRSGQRRSVAFRAASPKIISTLNEMTKSIQGGNDRFITELDENLRRSRLFTDKIERLHQDMLRVVYDKQLKSNYMAATDLSRLTTPSYR